MASHAAGSEHEHQNDDSDTIDPSAPFRGVIVCCTSIPPEQRTDIAQKVQELGGIHKYDLTPEVTHLVVGDYDTPKYRHVARERNDIKAMDAAWIEAVTDIWKRDDHLDFAALEKEYQLKALEKAGAEASLPGQPPVRDSLLICLTGFGDQREEIADQITASGGRYTGDLTRRCTHLIVNKPEGKKFGAAKSWGVITVTLDWLLLSIERGMILEEAKFDPMLSPEELGVGAWVKSDPRPALNKRSRSAVSNGTEEGPRKLRKTASMKLNSQRNHIWGDILGRPASRDNSFAHDGPPGERAEVPTQQLPAPTNRGIFSDCVFFTHGFTKERSSILQQTIATLDGRIAATLDDAAHCPAPADPFHRFLIVPQASQPESHPQVPGSDIYIITEFYIEKCLHNKRFFPPDEHVLGRPFPAFPIDGFADLRISSAAFTGIELGQVARSVTQLGATFAEIFDAQTSLVVCRSLTEMRQEKLRLALKWGVPVVSADWLWECISTGFNVPIDEYLFPELKQDISSRVSPVIGVEKKTTRAIAQRSRSEPQPKTFRPGARPPAGAGVDTTAFDSDGPQIEQVNPLKRAPHEDSIVSADFTTARTHQAQSLARDSDAPLSERSSSSLNKSPPLRTASIANPEKPTSREKTPVAETHAPSASPERARPSASQAAAAKAQAKAAERLAISTKLTTLISAPASLPPADSTASPPRPRRRQVLGRAISNASSVEHRTRSANAGEAEEEAEAPPAGTQLEYADPEAKSYREAALSRMMGGSGEVKGKPVGTAAGGRSMRRR